MYLVTYRPLCGTPFGLHAIARYGLPPFIDSSCRREPDFQSKFPTITALCRAGKFAPRLEVDDRVAYITAGSWYLVAILRVTERLNSHEEAAEWFRFRGLPLPSNIMVDGNPHQPLERTAGLPPGVPSIGVWNASYKERARAHGVVLVCEAPHLELHHPPQITREDWSRWIGKVPATQNPKNRPELWEHLWAATSRNSPASDPPGLPRSAGSGSGRATISSGSTGTSRRRGC
ncbi:MAG TPA: hypothetical protein VM733_23120 [Thermoanaerobaculia bacterium]|nr:hypothetical protein [Thermoanaerobaculia bacterium]